MGSLLQALFFGPLISMTGTQKMGMLAVETNKKDLASGVRELARDAASGGIA